MSELIVTRTNSANARRHLLASASAIALTAFIAVPANAESDDRPTVWIELGGQLERIEAAETRFSPQFVSQINTSTFTSPIVVQQPPRYANGVEGGISLQPENSDWIFSASVRYGRSNNQKNVHEQLPAPSGHKYVDLPIAGLHITDYPVPANGKSFVTTVSHHDESHAVLDFKAGKDVGLGIFDNPDSLTVNFGVRFAQFTSRSTTTIDADPNYHFQYKYITHYGPYPANIKLAAPAWNVYSFRGAVSRSFRGIGPSVGWDLSSAIVKMGEGASVNFDGGVDFAVLFGRQKTKAHHDTGEIAGHKPFNNPIAGTAFTSGVYHHSVYNAGRSRSVVAPNVGGYAGISFRFPNAKVSFGYRADFFFGAMDGGIDTRRSEAVGFHGPFATISVGLGG